MSVKIKDIVKKILENSKDESGDENFYTETTKTNIEGQIGGNNKSDKYKKLFKDCINYYVLTSGSIENFYSYDLLSDYVSSLINPDGSAADPLDPATNNHNVAAANFDQGQNFNIDRLYSIYDKIDKNLKNEYDLDLTNIKYKEIFLANELTRLFFNVNVDMFNYLGIYKGINLKTLNDGIQRLADNKDGLGGGDENEFSSRINNVLNKDFNLHLLNYIQTGKIEAKGNPGNGDYINATAMNDGGKNLYDLIHTINTGNDYKDKTNYEKFKIIFILSLFKYSGLAIHYEHSKPFINNILKYNEIVSIDKKEDIITNIKIASGHADVANLGAENVGGGVDLAEIIAKGFIYGSLFFYSLNEDMPYNANYKKYIGECLLLDKIKDNKVNQALLNLLGLCDYKFFVVKKNKNENFSLDNCVTLKNSSKENFKNLLGEIKKNIEKLNNHDSANPNEDLPVFNFDEEYKKFINDEDNIFHFDLSIVYKYLFIVKKIYKPENNKILDNIHFSLSRILKSIRNSQFYTQQSRYVNEFFDNVFTTLETTRYDLKKTIEYSFLTDFSSNRIGNTYTIDEQKILNLNTTLNTSIDKLLEDKKINIGDYFLVSQTGNMRDAIIYTYLYDDYGKPKILGINPSTGKKEVFNVNNYNKDHFKNCGVVSIRNLQELPSEGKRGVIKLDEYHYNF